MDSLSQKAKSFDIVNFALAAAVCVLVIAFTGTTITASQALLKEPNLSDEDEFKYRSFNSASIAFMVFAVLVLVVVAVLFGLRFKPPAKQRTFVTSSSSA